MNDAKVRATHKLEDAQSQLGDDLEGMDIFSLLMMVSNDTGDDPEHTLGSHLFKEILRFSQSNPNKSYQILKEMIDLDNQIAIIDGEPEKI